MPGVINDKGATDTLADKKLDRVFVGLSGKVSVPSIGGKRYTLIVRDDDTIHTSVPSSEQVGRGQCVRIIPSRGLSGRYNIGCYVRSIRQRGRMFRSGIRQKFTPADSTNYNSVAERVLALISDPALAARIQAQVLYPGAPSYPSLWAEAVSWACNALNHTTTKANPGNKSPYEMRYGSPPLAGEVWSFLKPAIYRVERENKSQPKAQDCYYVGSSVKHPHDCMPVLTTYRTILTTRNITW